MSNASESPSSSSPWIVSGIRFAIHRNNATYTLAWTLPGEGRSRKSFPTVRKCRAHARKVAAGFRASHVTLEGARAADYLEALALLRKAGHHRPILARIVGEWRGKSE